MANILRTSIALVFAGSILSPIVPALAQGTKPTAADIIGLSHFVDHHCKGYKTNQAVVMVVLKAAGETERSLMRPEIINRSRVLSNNFARDTAKSCRLAWNAFGDNGVIFPGMVVPRGH